MDTGEDSRINDIEIREQQLLFLLSKYDKYPENGGICNNLISENAGLLYHDIGKNCHDYKRKEIKRLSTKELKELDER